LDAAAALLAIRDAVIPPTPLTKSVAAGLDLDVVAGHPRPRRLETVLVLARGRLGFNSALIVTALDGTAANS
jgi:act minimal PKS chain-length factor (CLF/KS beta)